MPRSRPSPIASQASLRYLKDWLPEGPQLEALLRMHKIDRSDTFRQLVIVGADLVGSLTVKETVGKATREPQES